MPDALTGGMMPQVSRNGVAGELQQLAREYENPGLLLDLANQLRGSAQGAPGGDRALLWATVGLQEAFLGGAAALRIRTGPGWKYVHVLLEVLVFVPVFLTWTGLIFATFAYRAALSAGALGGESFLQGWQTGFSGHLLGIFEFGWLAVYTVVAVGALIALAAASARNRLHEQSAQSRLAEALLKADLELAEYRLGAPERLARRLDLTSNRLDGTVTAIAAAAQAAAEVQHKAVDALNAVIPALASLEGAASSIKSVPDLLGSQLDQAGNAFRGSTLQVNHSVSQLSQVLGDIASAQREVVKSGNESSSKIAGVLAVGATQMHDALVDVSSTAAAYAYRVELAADVLGQTQEILNRHLPGAVNGMTAALVELRGDVTRLGDRLSRLETALSSDPK